MQKHIFNKRTMLFDGTKNYCLRFIICKIYKKSLFYILVHFLTLENISEYFSLWYILKNILAYFHDIGLHT